MTLSEQGAILVEYADQGLIRHEDLVNWACVVIEQMDEPPIWVIEVATMAPSQLLDSVSIVREHASVSPPLHPRIQITVMAYLSGEQSLTKTLSELFRLIFLDDREGRRDELDERLIDTLVEWDCQEDLDVVGPPLREKFEALFREYMADARTIAEMLPLKYKNLL